MPPEDCMTKMRAGASGFRLSASGGTHDTGAKALFLATLFAALKGCSSTVARTAARGRSSTWERFALKRGDFSRLSTPRASASRLVSLTCAGEAPAATWGVLVVRETLRAACLRDLFSRF